MRNGRSSGDGPVGAGFGNEAFGPHDLHLRDLAFEVRDQCIGQLLRRDLLTALDARQVSRVTADGDRDLLQRLLSREAGGPEGGIHVDQPW